MVNIAIYNSFPFHYEMFGYIIYYCHVKNHNLTIYTNSENAKGWLFFYKQKFNTCNFSYKNMKLFDSEKNNYELIFLPTDDDMKYDDNNSFFNNKTIRIDHNYLIRRPTIDKFIAVRPFLENYRKWSLPCYPLINTFEIKSQLISNDKINICILGESLENYNVNIINRLKCFDKKIIINAIARNVSYNKFNGLSRDIKLNIFKNINTIHMMNIISNCNYLLTDVSINKNYEYENMSGCIPFSFSLLATLIISKQTNKFYNFKNVIEFDKNTNDDILLQEININNLIMERQDLTNTFHNYVDEYIKTL